MSIGDIVQRYPETFPVFMGFGLHCVGCHVAAFETIEMGAMAHGINVDELVAELNKVVSQKAPEQAAAKKKPAKSESKSKPAQKAKSKPRK